METRTEAGFMICNYYDSSGTKDSFPFAEIRFERTVGELLTGLGMLHGIRHDGTVLTAKFELNGADTGRFMSKLKLEFPTIIEGAVPDYEGIDHRLELSWQGEPRSHLEASTLCRQGIALVQSATGLNSNLGNISRSAIFHSYQTPDDNLMLITSLGVSANYLRYTEIVLARVFEGDNVGYFWAAASHADRSLVLYSLENNATSISPDAYRFIKLHYPYLGMSTKLT